MEVQINFELDITDLKHYNFLKYKDLLNNRKIKIIAYFMIILFVLIPIFDFILDKQIDYLLLILSIFLIILYFFFPYISSISLKYYFERDKFLQEQRRFTINDNGILIETDISIINVSFDRIYRIIEDKHIIAILIGFNRGFVLPKRVLNQNELVQIADLFSKNLAQDKLRLYKSVKK